MAGPRKVFVKIRDFSQDSAVVRPHPPVEPRPRPLSKDSGIRPASRKLIILPKITTPEKPPLRQIQPVIRYQPSRLEDAAVLHYEDVCLPYELDDGPKVNLKIGERQGSFARRVDLRKGSFSKKQIISPRTNLSVSIDQGSANKPVIKLEIMNPPSSQPPNRSFRMQQISKKFIVNKEALESKNVRHRPVLSEPPPPRPEKSLKRLSADQPQNAPFQEWMSSLEKVTHITDFSIKVKPAFPRGRRVYLK